MISLHDSSTRLAEHARNMQGMMKHKSSERVARSFRHIGRENATHALNAAAVLP